MELVSLFKKNKILILSILVAVCAILSESYMPIEILCSFIIIVAILYLPISDGFILALFSIAFYTSFSNVLYCVCFCLLAIKSILAYRHERWDNLKKIVKFVVFLSILYLVSVCIIKCFILKNYEIDILYNVVTFLCILIFVYFTAGHLDIKKALEYFIYGIIVSSLLSCMCSAFDYGAYELYTISEDGIKMYSFNAINSNILARNCVMGLVFLAVMFFKNNDIKQIVIYAILTCLLIVIGLLTCNVLFYVGIALIVLFSFVCGFIKSKNKMQLTLVFGIIIVIALLAIVPYINSVLEKYNGFYEDSSLINTFFSDKNAIWSPLLQSFSSNWTKILFGSFNFKGYGSISGVQNMYLSCLYSFGIVGVLAFLTLILVFIFNSKILNKSPIYFIGLVVIALCGIIDDYFASSLGFVAIILGFLMCSNFGAVDNKNENYYLKLALYNSIKRVFDVFVSLIALIIFCIPMIIVGILVKCTSSGPLFFKDKRIGSNGKTIYVYKFRSMYKDAEARLEQYLTKEQLEMWHKERKIENDPRITKIGRIIRKTSLDELPQLINILKGDLSIVGNRPISKLEYDTYFNDKEKKELDSMRPGLTGYWQVYGRSNVTFASGKRQKMCLYYVKKASIWLDLKIFIKTFVVVIFKKGAR